MSNNKNFQHTYTINSEVSQEILRAIDELKQGSGYGSVEIVLHESRVTQIEKREKIRITKDTKPTLTVQTAAK